MVPLIPQKTVFNEIYLNEAFNNNTAAEEEIWREFWKSSRAIYPQWQGLTNENIYVINVNYTLKSFWKAWTDLLVEKIKPWICENDKKKVNFINEFAQLPYILTVHFWNRGTPKTMSAHHRDGRKNLHVHRGLFTKKISRFSLRAASQMESAPRLI